MQRKYFGTDGIRGHVGSENINPEFILKLGWAVGKVLGSKLGRKIIIGKDTRVSGYMLESALEAGLSAAGVDIALLGPMPTPAIAYLTQTLRANAGIVISASHNLFEDNGIKFFSAEGGKITDDIESTIEDYIAKPMQIVSSEKLGKATRINDASGRYIEFCKSTIPSLTRLIGLKVVVDCANGATYHIAPNVFTELGAQVTSIGTKPDGFNINQNCGSTAPEQLAQKVLETGADIGIGLDGDGDRVILINSRGEVINGDQILYIIAKDRNERDVLNGGVVGTVMTNYGLELAFKTLNIPFLRSNVGDRYVLETLRNNNWRIGGETSGHIVCLDKTTTGDGIIAALQVLSIMIKKDKTLDELVSDIHLLPQSLNNLQTKNALVLANNKEVHSVIKKFEKHLQGKGRVLLRPSGTEPLLRVMVEGEDPILVKQQAQQLCDDISTIEKKLVANDLNNVISE